MPSSTNHIFFIDARVADYSSLIDGLPEESAWFVLDAAQDGITQMQSILADYSGLDSIQIISHGAPATLYLGSSVLTSQNLAQYENALGVIGGSLNETGDILLYGCNVARGEAGLEFINNLALFSGADVAASNDATGALELSGDWQLESSTGAVEAVGLSIWDFQATLDVITGDDLSQEIIGTFGDDVISGLGGNDRLDGQAGNDNLDGGTGNDILIGGFGNDTLLGGSGDDELSDDQGTNHLDGGSGNDSLSSSSLTGTHTLIGGLGQDNLNASGKSLIMSGGDDSDHLSASGNANGGTVQKGTATLSGGSGDDSLQAYFISSALLQGDDGNDSLSAEYSKNVTLEGGIGQDNLYANFYGYYLEQMGETLGMSALLDGGDDDDILSASGSGLHYGYIDLSLDGGNGNDTLSVNEGKQAVLDGGEGNDLLTASGVMELTFTGGTGIDTFELTAQQYQTLLAGAQQYRTQSGTTFSYVYVDPLTTQITDFAAGSGGDVLDVTGLLRDGALNFDGSNPFTAGYLKLVQIGADTLVEFDPDGSAGSETTLLAIAILKGVTAANLTSENFTPNYPTGYAPTDTTAPTVTTFSPVDAATGVALTSDIVLTFSEAIQRGTGSIFLKNAGGIIIETFDVATSNRLSLSDETLTINPTNDLAQITHYFVNFAPGTIEDLAGNAYAGTTAYDFTTGTATAPTEVVVLTTESSTYTISAGSSTIVYGTSGADDITLQTGASATLRNFIGNNVITIEAESSLFSVSRSGATVTIGGTDGTILKIPATSTAQNIAFNDVSYDLLIDAGDVYFGDQVVNYNSDLDLNGTNVELTGVALDSWQSF